MALQLKQFARLGTTAATHSTVISSLLAQQPQQQPFTTQTQLQQRHITAQAAHQQLQQPLFDSFIATSTASPTQSQSNIYQAFQQQRQEQEQEQLQQQNALHISPSSSSLFSIDFVNNNSINNINNNSNNFLPSVSSSFLLRTESGANLPSKRPHLIPPPQPNTTTNTTTTTNQHQLSSSLGNVSSILNNSNNSNNNISNNKNSFNFDKIQSELSLFSQQQRQERGAIEEGEEQTFFDFAPTSTSTATIPFDQLQNQQSSQFHLSPTNSSVTFTIGGGDEEIEEEEEEQEQQLGFQFWNNRGEKEEEAFLPVSFREENRPNTERTTFHQLGSFLESTNWEVEQEQEQEQKQERKQALQFKDEYQDFETIESLSFSTPFATATKEEEEAVVSTNCNLTPNQLEELESISPSADFLDLQATSSPPYFSSSSSTSSSVFNNEEQLTFSGAEWNTMSIAGKSQKKKKQQQQQQTQGQGQGQGQEMATTKIPKVRQTIKQKKKRLQDANDRNKELKDSLQEAHTIYHAATELIYLLYLQQHSSDDVSSATDTKDDYAMMEEMQQLQ